MSKPITRPDDKRLTLYFSRKNPVHVQYVKDCYLEVRDVPVQNGPQMTKARFFKWITAGGNVVEGNMAAFVAHLEVKLRLKKAPSGETINSILIAEGLRVRAPRGSVNGFGRQAGKSRNTEQKPETQVVGKGTPVKLDEAHLSTLNRMAVDGTVTGRLSSAGSLAAAPSSECVTSATPAQDFDELMRQDFAQQSQNIANRLDVKIMDTAKASTPEARQQIVDAFRENLAKPDEQIGFQIVLNTDLIIVEAAKGLVQSEVMAKIDHLMQDLTVLRDTVASIVNHPTTETQGS